MSIAMRVVRSIVDAVRVEKRRKRAAIQVIEAQNSKHNPAHHQPSAELKRYHIGCGPILADGFLNIDGDFECFEKRLKSGVLYAVDGKPSTYILKHDLRSGIPAAANSLQIIYHSHFLEHLADQEGMVLISECHRCLAPGALMRFAVPDFRLWCTNYLTGKNDFFDWYRQTYLADNKVRYKTNASVFMGMLYNWGHRMAYDYESLSVLLTRAGFANVKHAEWGTSDNIPEISSVESATSHRRLESLVIECTKAVSP